MTVTDPRVVRDHWRGGGDVVELVGATAMVAKNLLPAKIRRVLSAHVEVNPSLPDLMKKSGGERPVDHSVDSVRQPTNY